jgi:sugar phosphate isomerase/epimerase
MRLRLGINTCFAVKRWPRPVDWAPIVAEQLGLGLVQHSLDLVDLAAGMDGIARQAKTIRGEASTYGLRVESTFTGLAAYSANLLLDPDAVRRASALAWYRQAIHFSGLLGASATGGHVGALSVADASDPVRRTDRWADLQQSLGELAADARVAGLQTVLVENLAAGREPSTMEQIRSLIRPATGRAAAVALCLDVGHMCVAGTSGDDRDPYAWLRIMGRDAPIIQLQQSDDLGDHHWPFTAERNRTGRIDADRVLDALGASGAQSADLILEVIPPFEQEDDEVLQDLRVSVAYWRDSLRRRGHEAA